MSKLFKLKEWLTITDAARHLSIVLGEEVSVADVLRLALDDHLRIAVYFPVTVFARSCARLGEHDEISRVDFTLPDGKVIRRVPEHCRAWGDRKGVFQVQYSVGRLEGVWDLAMDYGGRAEVERICQGLPAGKISSPFIHEGIVVESPSGSLYELQVSLGASWNERAPHFNACDHPDDFHAADRLPDDAILVIRTDALRDFEQSINPAPEKIDTPLRTRERNTLLSVIAVLCKEAKLDHTKPAKAASLIQAMAARMGISIGETTIEGHLKKIPEALEARTK